MYFSSHLFVATRRALASHMVTTVKTGLPVNKIWHAKHPKHDLKRATKIIYRSNKKIMPKGTSDIGGGASGCYDNCKNVSK